MALNTAAIWRYLSGIIPNYTSTDSKVSEFPEYRDNLDLAFKHYSLGLASGAAPLGTSDEGDIRILEIFPHSTGLGRIRGALLHYCFILPARRIPYAALSYYWGNQDEDRLIVINGKGFLVTEILQTMLWRLRQPDRSVYVWIDAICIYQRMEKEKKVQLGMMKDIYSTAEDVVVYLGDEADNTHLVGDFAERIVKKLMPLEDSDPDVRIRAADLASFGLPSMTDPGWAALRAVFKRPWFERKWVVQECALAKSITCLLGGSCFDFNLLILAYKLCLNHKLNEIYISGGHTLGPPREHPMLIIIIIRDLIRRNFDGDTTVEAKKLRWLLGATSYAKVSKHPHDHIYGLLGMHEVSGDLVGLPYPLIDYNRPLSEVFIDYACIDDWKAPGPDTSLLELASQSKYLSLPSWVPDWTRPTPIGYVVYPTLSKSFTASRGTDRSNFSFDRDLKRLTIRARVFDKIAHMTANDDGRFFSPHGLEFSAMDRMGFGFLRELSKMELCQTVNGHSVFVNAAALPGDEIAIVHGERSLFVLRRVGSNRKLIGCAFFSKLMEGEGLDPTSEYYTGSVHTLTLM